jgi:YidC/Oxa1 family membrane protein insertase
MESLFSPFIDLADAIITFLHDDVGLVYGTAIVGLTFITRALILPLSVKQIRSMREMSAIQPLLKEIQEKYKDDRQRMQREQMRLFQEHGVNPLASCFPLLLQLPVFIALFYLLQGDEFQNEVMAAGEESWLFVDDLTENATGSSLIILLILYIATSVIAGLIMTGGRSASAQQRMIALGLPLIFTPIMISFPAGLLVYWVATNIWTMGQQAVVRLFFPPPPQPTPETEATTLVGLDWRRG